MSTFQGKLFTVTVLCFFIAGDYDAAAQERVVVFQNTFSGKKVILRSGDEVHMRFTVHDTADAPLDIAVSNLTVSGSIEWIGEHSFRISSKNKYFDRATVTVPLTSVEAFRKYSEWRPVAKTASVIGASAIGLLASLQISSSGDVLSWQNAGLAIGASAAVVMSRQFFPVKMKYYAVEGWAPNVCWAHVSK
jgi:hypothetical protein